MTTSATYGSPVILTGHEISSLFGPGAASPSAYRRITPSHTPTVYALSPVLAHRPAQPLCRCTFASIPTSVTVTLSGSFSVQPVRPLLGDTTCNSSLLASHLPPS